MLTFTGKHLSIFHVSDQTRQQIRVFLTSEGGGRPQSFTQAVPNQLKLGKEG